jgi:uncharacterized protein (TIGR02145 family)
MKIICLILVVTILCVDFAGCKKDDDAAPTPRVTPAAKPIIFGPSTFGSVKDVEGTEYKTIVIGSKTWMAENLKTGTYQDGTAIQKGLSQSDWTQTTSGAVCNYEDNATNTTLYGSLYNEYVKTDSRKVCPVGWHIPSGSEWLELASHLGGIGIAGGKMKETGTTHWIVSNAGADNASGFTGLPGGSRHKGSFNDMGTDGYWWSSAPSDFFYLTNSETALRTKSTALPDEGLSIRCVKD